MSSIAIISPSGNFYGSEQVLYDFLESTERRYHIYVQRGILQRRLQAQRKHYIHTFFSIKLLYAKIAFLLLINHYDGVYINEAGHSKYINKLADMFPNKKFFIHIRLLEDSKKERLGLSRRNIVYVSVSDYIAEEVRKNTNISCHTITDLYIPTCAGLKEQRIIKKENAPYKLGVVGRVTPTKGLKDIVNFCNFCDVNEAGAGLEFHFFGGVESHKPEVEDFLKLSAAYNRVCCIFHGFVDDREQMYHIPDILLHFNKLEPLGRIFIESIDFHLPFVGFKSGGIGELAEKFGLESYMIEDTQGWEARMFAQIQHIIRAPEETSKAYRQARESMQRVCSPRYYTHEIEKLLHG